MTIFAARFVALFCQAIARLTR